MPFLPALTCRHCQRPILFPFPTQDEISPDQMPWPQDGQPRNVLCLSCMRACAYSAEECHWHRVTSQDQHLLNTPRAVYRVSVPCGIGQCAGLVGILAVMKEGSTRLTAIDLLPQICAIDIPCERGDLSNGQHWRGGTLDFREETDWPR